MFYAHFVLSKKGPLAKVWLAAHWERKLTKAHVFETNIEETVDDILNPKVKLALRTSGHLLLGVVRIYSRKAKYLLQDCNDALGRIKLAFRPVSIDLPVEARVATKAAVTLAVTGKEMVPREYNMTEIDFDMDFEELSDHELSVRFRSNQALEDSITLKETVIGEHQLKKDNALIVDFGGFGMDDIDFDLPLEVGEAKSPLFGRRNIFGDRVDEGEKEVGVAFDDADDILDVAPPPTGVDTDAQENGQPMDTALPLDAADVLRAGQNEVSLMNGDDIPPIILSDTFTDPAPLPTVSARTSVDPLGVKPLTEPTERGKPTEATERGERGERMRVKRKRKLLIDEQKTITSDEMRMQLQDTSDVVRALDMAPSTLKLMYIKENSTVEKMWNMPGYMGDEFEAPGFSHKLVSMFSERALLPLEEDVGDSDDFFPNTSSVATLMTMSHDFDINEEHAIVPDFGETAGTKRIRQNEDPSHSSLLPEEEQGDVPYPHVEPLEHDIQDVQHVQHVQSSVGHKKARISNGDSDEESLDEDAHPEDHDRMSRRTKVVFDQFAALLTRRHTPRHSNPDGSLSVNFKELVRGHQTRKEVAQRFYSTLVLKKLQALDVEQTEPYGDIWLKKGGRFDKFEV